ncbi:MAG: hypothetical protein AAF682_13095 [Planctomycetota bacterium]
MQKADGLSDTFGVDVALSEGLLVVGNPAQSEVRIATAGSGGGYTLVDYVGSPSTFPSDSFGECVGVERTPLLFGGWLDTIYVGDPKYPGGGTVFRYIGSPGDSWAFEICGGSAITGVGDSVDFDARLGAAFDNDDGQLIFGAPDNKNGGGSAYIFDSWESPAVSCRDLILQKFGVDFLYPEPNHLGASVAIDGNRAVVGAPGEGGMPGTVWSFERIGGAWECTGVIIDPIIIFPGPDYVERGTRLALDGDRVLISQRSSPGAGFVTVMYSNQGAGWLPDSFYEQGLAADLSADRAVLSGNASSGPSFCETYAVWPYYRSTGGAWIGGPKLNGPTLYQTFLGARVALDGEEIAIGYPATLCFGTGLFEGRVDLEDLECYGGPAGDCDSDNIPNFVEVHAGLVPDCNGDQVPDGCVDPMTVSVATSEPDGTVCQGAGFTLTANATVLQGSSAPSVSWYDTSVSPAKLITSTYAPSDGTKFAIRSSASGAQATSTLTVSNFQGSAGSTSTKSYEARASFGTCSVVTASKSTAALPYPTLPMITSTAPVCVGDSLSLCAPTGYTSYSWRVWNADDEDWDDLSVTTACLSLSTSPNLPTGDYAVYATNASGCGVQSATFSVVDEDVITKPVITAPMAAVCQGSPLELTVPTGFGHYEWLLDGVSLAGKSFASGIATNKLSLATDDPGLIAGNYTVKIGPEGASCTVESDIEAIGSADVLSLAVASSAAGAVCQGADFTVTATAALSTSGAVITWYDTSVTPAQQITGAYTPADGTTFAVTPGGSGTSPSSVLTVSNFQGDAAQVQAKSFEARVSDGGCALTQAASVDALPYPVQPIVDSNAPVCEGDDLVLSAPAGYSSYSWLAWNPTDLAWEGLGVTTSDLNLSTSPDLSTGDYAVVVTNASGCAIQSDSFEVVEGDVITEPEVTLAGGLACDGALIFTAPSGFGHYEWFLGTTSLVGASFASGASTSELVVETQDLSLIGGDYTVRVGPTGGGCTVASAAVPIDPDTLEAKVDWIGPDDATSSFSDAANWTPCGPPQAEVCVNQASTGLNTLLVDGSFSVERMSVWQELSGFLQILHIGAGAELDVRTELSLGDGALVELEGGVLTAGPDGAGSVVLAGDDTECAGEGTFPLTPEISGRGQIDLSIDNGRRVTASGGTLVLDGAVVTNRENALISTTSAVTSVLDIQAGAFVQEGTIDVGGMSEVRFAPTTGLTNEGRIHVGAEGTLVAPWLFVNFGTWTCAQPAGKNGLYVEGTVELPIGSALTNEGWIECAGGTIKGLVTNNQTFLVNDDAESVVDGNFSNFGVVGIAKGSVLQVKGHYIGTDHTGSGECYEGGDFGEPSPCIPPKKESPSPDGSATPAVLIVRGDFVLDADASIGLDGLLDVHGDWSVAIDDPARMELAGLRCRALLVPQAVEAVGVEFGTPGDWSAPALNAMGLLEIGPDLAQVMVRDDFDNSGNGTPNVLYAETLVVRSGSMLATEGCTVRAGHLELEPGSTLDLEGGTVYYETVSPANPGAPGSGVTLTGSGELLPAPAPDCDQDGVSDADEIAAGAPDCDGNGIPDDCDYALGLAFDLDGDQTPDGCQQLSADTPFVSLAAGTRQELRLHAGTPFGGGMYFLGGSATGTTPGFAFGGTVVPLNFDPYTWQTLALPDTLPLLGNLGFLDAQGEAVASFGFPAGYEPLLAGLTLFHAFVVLEPSTFGIELVSNYVTVELQP